MDWIIKNLDYIKFQTTATFFVKQRDFFTGSDFRWQRQEKWVVSFAPIFVVSYSSFDLFINQLTRQLLSYLVFTLFDVIVMICESRFRVRWSSFDVKGIV